MPGMHSLPPGFEFRPYVDGPGLYLEGRVIATACPANGDPGAPWRLCISPKGSPRCEFLRDEDACLRYMAAWATKWEAEIRRARVDVGTGHPYGDVRAPSEPSRHPRGRSRRHSGL